MHSRTSFTAGILVSGLVLLIQRQAASDDVIVFSCHQTWDSRIYVLDMDGRILDWHQYDFYRLCDLELVNGEVHVADAFAPRSFRVDLQTWELETIIDDWSLYYFYDLAFDGQFLYVTEWDMNRYLPDGTRDSSADFDHDVFGSCFSGGLLWTLNGDGLVRCWDIQGWPEILEVPSASFSPPGDSCRGLWYDGQYFWSAEALDSAPGMIYRFDDSGSVVDQLPAPAFTGWSACVYAGYSSGLDKTTWARLKTLPD